MPIAAFPRADAPNCTNWTPSDLTLYNSLPAWFVRREVAFRKPYGAFKRIFGSVDWDANKGSTMTGIVVEPPPKLRQFAFPNKVQTAAAKKDIIQHRERTFQWTLAHQKFESPVFQWLASFTNFINDHVMKSLDFVLQWQEDYTSTFYRGQIFHRAPVIAFADHATTEIDELAPTGEGDAAGSTGKSNAYLAVKIADIGAPGNLSMRFIGKMLNYMEQDSKVPAYQSGSASDDSFLNEKFLLLTSSEVWNSFQNDPYVRENKDCNLNIITQGFTGSLFGRLTTALHSDPIRIARATDGTISFPAPDTIQEEPTADNYGQTIRNPAYRDAQYEVAFLCGAKGYDLVKVGSPPADFAKASSDKLGQMSWNGKPMLTDNLLVPCVGEDSSTVWEPNTYREFLKIISYVIMGIAPVTPRNVVPIVFKRKRTLDAALF